MSAPHFAKEEQLALLKSLKKRRLFRRVLMPLGLILFGVIGFAVLKANRPAPEKKETAKLAMLVSTLPVQLESVQMNVTSQGTVVPRTQTSVVAEVSGKIASVSPKDAGWRVLS